MHQQLTATERALYDRLPKPPPQVTVRPNGVYIVEWLPEGERRTGALLHDWLNNRRKSLSVLSTCTTKADVLQAIEEVAADSERTGVVPILHLESHGHHDGLIGPDGADATALLSWAELTTPLQQLNLATRCNLMVFVAACTGFAAIQAFVRGPRAPAVALVGPDDEVTPKNLLEGTKEFYRRWFDPNAQLEDLAASASREAGSVGFEVEPFATLAYEAKMLSLIRSLRPNEQRARQTRIRDRLLIDTKLSDHEIESRIQQIPAIPPSQELQRIWDEMFMIDLYPENRARFGVDMTEIAKLLSESLGKT